MTIYRREYYSYPERIEQVGTYCAADSLKTALRYPGRIDVVFRTDSWYEKRGFKFQYHTDTCGGDVTTSSYIDSTIDAETNTYFGNMKCTWNITAPADKRIVIRFEQFDLEPMDYCYMDYVEVYEGHANAEKMRKARLCGNLTHIAPAVSIATNKALVRFVTDDSYHYRGFRALILFPKMCDRVINLTVAAPTYRLDELFSTYEPLLDCHYLVAAPAGYVVQVKFNQFHLAPCLSANESCTCDFVTIHDGSGPFAEPIATYCGHTTPADAISSDAALWMRFSTDGVSESTGFSATFQAVRSLCGETKRKFTDANTIIEIESPNYSGMYLPNMNCVWEIEPQDQRLLDVKFERFDLQGPDDDKQCSADYLKIKDASENDFISEGLGENIVYSGPSLHSKQLYFFHVSIRSAPEPNSFCTFEDSQIIFIIFPGEVLAASYANLLRQFNAHGLPVFRKNYY